MRGATVCLVKLPAMCHLLLYTYSAECARRKFLQMPLSSVRIGKPCNGKSFSVLLESFPGIQNFKISHLLNGLVEISKIHNPKQRVLQQAFHILL